MRWAAAEVLSYCNYCATLQNDVMDNLTSAQKSITAEIKRLAAEQARLEKILSQLGGRAVTTSAVTGAEGAEATPKRRGRKPKPRPAVNEADLSAAMKMIEEAGRKGIRAIRLASLLKKDGVSKPDKAALLGTDKVRLSGNGGAATYTWVD